MHDLDYFGELDINTAETDDHGHYEGNALDNLLSSFKPEVYKEEYYKYKAIKTDAFTNSVNIQMGVDGYSWKTFEKNIDIIAKYACYNMNSGKYFFKPFREIDIPKAPYVRVKSARDNNAIRTISIATIKDTVTQRVIYKVINGYFEQIFNQIAPDVNYGYRKGKSPIQAVINVYNDACNGYSYALHCDIENFFDNVSHEILGRTLEEYISSSSKAFKVLKRYYSADRTPFSDYNGNVKKYYRKKPLRITREKGIAQGGVLSGLLSNIYLHKLDLFAVTFLKDKYGDVNYYRYADDFVFMMKTDYCINDVYNDLYSFIKNELNLNLHALGEKTKIVRMTYAHKDTIEFLGFKISPKGISIGEKNTLRFMSRIKNIISRLKISDKYDARENLVALVKILNFKILGSRAYNKIRCSKCGKMYKHRSWLSYFLVMTDIRPLKGLDTWIRKQIYEFFYKEAKIRFDKNDLINAGLASLEHSYYTYKLNSVNSQVLYCSCHMEKENQALNKDDSCLLFDFSYDDSVLDLDYSQPRALRVYETVAGDGNVDACNDADDELDCIGEIADDDWDQEDAYDIFDEWYIDDDGNWWDRDEWDIPYP